MALEARCERSAARPVGVAVHHLGGAGRMHPGHGGGHVDVGRTVAVEAFARLAGAADLGGHLHPLGQAPGQEGLLPSSAAHLAAEGLVWGVAQAQRIAVRQQDALAPGGQHGRVGQRHRPRGLEHRAAEQEVAVADHESHGAAAARFGQHVDALAVERQVARIVADPCFEQVAEDVHRVGLRVVQVSGPAAESGRQGLAQVQVGNEVDGAPMR